LLDRSQTARFCEALLRDSNWTNRIATRDRPSCFVHQRFTSVRHATALNIAQLELLLRGFHERLELSQLVEWTIEAIREAFRAKGGPPGKNSESTGSASACSRGTRNYEMLGREHNAQPAERIVSDFARPQVSPTSTVDSCSFARSNH